MAKRRTPMADTHRPPQTPGTRTPSPPSPAPGATPQQHPVPHTPETNKPHTEREGREDDPHAGKTEAEASADENAEREGSEEPLPNQGYPDYARDVAVSDATAKLVAARTKIADALNRVEKARADADTLHATAEGDAELQALDEEARQLNDLAYRLERGDDVGDVDAAIAAAEAVGTANARESALGPTPSGARAHAAVTSRPGPPGAPQTPTVQQATPRQAAHGPEHGSTSA